MSNCEDSHLKDGVVPPIFTGTPPCIQQQQPPPLIKRLDLPMLSQQRNVLGNGMPVSSNTMNVPHQLQCNSASLSVATDHHAAAKFPSTVVQHKPTGNAAACKFESPHQQQGFHSLMQGLPNLPFFNAELPVVAGVGHKPAFIPKHQQPTAGTMFNYASPHQNLTHHGVATMPSATTRPKHLQLLHVPVPVQYYRPQSPSFSDLSSIMLTSPLSPASSTLSGGTAGTGTSDPQNLRSFLLNRRNATLPPLSNADSSLGNAAVCNPPPSTYNEDIDPTSQPPATSSLSPFIVDSATDASSTCTSISSRKRPHSGSPMSDLSEFGSIIRASPNSVIALLGQNQHPGILSLQSGQTNGSSMGHLIGQNNHLSAVPYQPHNYTVKEQETLIEQNQSFSHGNMDMKITNRITFSERPRPPVTNSVIKSEAAAVGLPLPPNTDNYLSTMDTEEQERLVCQWKGCFLNFNSVVELVQHLEKVHIEKGTVENFVCLWNDCPRKLKPFNARYKLIIHMRIHSGEKPNKCPYAGCSKAFSRLENLKIHIRTHTGEKPYTCQYSGCTKSFSNSSDRSKHQKTHYEEKPYACTYHGCEKRYTDPSSLRKHARSHSQKKKPRKENQSGSIHTHGISGKSKLKESTHYPSTTGIAHCVPHPQLDGPPAFSSPPDNPAVGYPHQSSDVYHGSNSISPQFHHVTSPPTVAASFQHPPSSFSPLDSTSNSPQRTFNTSRQHGGSTSDSSSVGGDIHSSLQPLSPTMNLSSLKESAVPPMHLPKYTDHPSTFNHSQSYIPEYVAPPPTYEDSLQHTYVPPYTYSTNQIQGQSVVVPELCHFN